MRYLLIISLILLTSCHDLTAFRKRLPVVDIYCKGKYIKTQAIITDDKEQFSTIVGFKLDTDYTKPKCSFKETGAYRTTYIYTDEQDPSPQFTIEKD
jgi:hypothetical protein